MKADAIYPEQLRPFDQMSDGKKWTYIIAYRNLILGQSDWTQLPDAVLTLAEKSAGEDYRQALRNIPQDFVNPDDVVFPTPPEFLEGWVSL